jgi:hypothetical protein
MPTRVCRYAIVIATCLIAASPTMARSGGGGVGAFHVTSTLDGKTVLPHRIHWVARPTGAAITDVDFLIDGRKAWVEEERPYTYGDDGNWLVTSALSPGKHHFTVRVTSASGKTVQRTTIARVLPPVSPPTDLAGGSWQRAVTQAQAGADTPAGIWVLTVDETGWRIKDPMGAGNWIDAAYRPGGLVELRGGIWTRANDTQSGNGWCQDIHAGPTNVPVGYAWAVSATTLTITLAGPDGCGETNAKQDLIVAGVWTRV